MNGVVTPAIVLFAIMVAHTLLETARDTLFLVRLGPGALAWVYLALAGVALVAYLALGRWARVRSPRHMLLGFLVAAAAGTGILAVALQVASWVVFVLYVWTGLVATMIVPTFWTLLDRSLRMTDAKLALARIGVGGVIGAIVGSGTAAVLARVLPTHLLVTAAALAYGLAACVAFALAPRPMDVKAIAEAPVAIPTPPPDQPAPPRSYLRILVALGVISTVALTLGDLVFKTTLAERVPASALATAFGAIYAGLNVVGLVIQIVITPRLLARWGVGGALVVLPLIMAATSFGFAATGATLAIVALKLGDGSLRYSLHRVGTEILFLPVPAELRDRSKPIIDAIGLRGGQALAALTMFALATLGTSARGSAAVAGVLAAVWLIGAIAARRGYVDAFHGKLAGEQVARDVRVPVLDADALAVLAEALASPDEIEALAALDVLAQHHRVPALVLYHPSTAVVHRALALLGGTLRPGVERVLGHLVDHADPEMRAAALVVASGSGTHAGRVQAALTDAAPAVRAVALVLRPEGADTKAQIAALVAGSTEDRVALAQAIGYVPDPRFASVLGELLERSEPRVARRVLRIYARRPDLANLERARDLLADPYVRGEARRALVQAGERGLAIAIAALDDATTPLAVRRQLPRTIGHIHATSAATALVSHLLGELDGTTEFKIVRALGRLHDEAPELPLDTTVVREYARRAIADAARYATFGDLVRADPQLAPSDLLAQLLDEKRAAAVERAFRALGIVAPDAHLRAVHDAIVGSDDVRRSTALEMLDDLLPADVRVPLVATIRTLSPDARRAALGPLAPGPFAHLDDAIAALLEDRSQSVREVVRYHVEHRARARDAAHGGADPTIARADA